MGTRRRPFACFANLRGLPVLRQGTASERYHMSGLRGAGAGAFVGPDGKSLPVPEDLPNAHMRLFGGAQYHRAMAEFRSGIGALTCPDISREEIVNACGIDDFHDGVNYTRTACVIAVSKARDTFEPFLHQARPSCCMQGVAGAEHTLRCGLQVRNAIVHSCTRRVPFATRHHTGLH